MALFKQKSEPSLGELDETLERQKIKEQIADSKANEEEKEAVIRQLKKEYGPNWAKRLGVGKLTDIASLKSFLRGAKKGLEKAGGSSNSSLNPGNFSGIRKA